MKLSCTLDELPTRLGERFGPSSWHRIDQSAVDLFAEATGDHQWIHVDRERARNGPFGTTIAHGYLTLALIPKLMSEVFEVTHRRMGLNYGLDRARFPRPLLVGSSVSIEGAVAEVLAVQSGFQVALDALIHTRDDETKPVCVARVISRYLR